MWQAVSVVNTCWKVQNASNNVPTMANYIAPLLESNSKSAGRLRGYLGTRFDIQNWLDLLCRRRHWNFVDIIFSTRIGFSCIRISK